MKVIFAKNIGFCFGVKRAIDIAEKSLKKNSKPIQFLGNLVHNEKVIEEFKKKGVEFRKNLKGVKSGTLIIQAHGFPPFFNKNNKLIIKDATCPLVKRVQVIANSLYKKGYKVIIIGDKNHAETKGIKGWCENRALIIENERQAKKIPKYKKIGAVTQTTQELDSVNQVLRILKNKTKELKYFNTLCPEVLSRQKELNLISQRVDGILVIGSRSSANTKRLVEIARKFKKPVWRINSLEELKEELKKDKLRGISVLGVTSGTSAPDWEIKKIKNWLNNLK